MPLLLPRQWWADLEDPDERGCIRYEDRSSGYPVNRRIVADLGTAGVRLDDLPAPAARVGQADGERLFAAHQAMLAGGSLRSGARLPLRLVDSKTLGNGILAVTCAPA